MSALLESFFRDGYATLPRAVSEEHVERALRVVNRTLGEGVKGLDLRPATHPDVLAPLHDTQALKTAIASLLGKPVDQIPIVLAAQIAARFPGAFCMPDSFVPVPSWKSFWHIDGMHEPPRIGNFTLLVGIALRDVTQDLCGNFTVFPRSHFVLQDYFRKHGFAEAYRGLKTLPALPLEDPVQVHLRAGDCILAHYQLAHTIAPNCGSEIRTMLFYRLNVHADGHTPDSMTDIWRDWNPVLQGFQPPAYSSSAALRKGSYEGVTARMLAPDSANDGFRKETAEKLFQEKKWAQAAPLFMALCEAEDAEWLLKLKAGICFTAGPKSGLEKGETILRQLLEILPSYANTAVVLARNLARQDSETHQTRHRPEALDLARRALLEMAPAEDCCVDAVALLNELRHENLNQLVEAAALRYPEKAVQIRAAGEPNLLQGAWERGRKWLAKPKKDAKLGVSIFQDIIALSPSDYWANVMLGACLLWSGGPLVRALKSLDVARSVDSYPHAYTIGAQVLEALKRPDEAVDRIADMLDQSNLKLEEPDHYDKIVEAMQLVARCCKDPARVATIRKTAMALFPSIASRIGKA